MPVQTIAFFGATGDCAGHALALALKAGYDCIALVRTPTSLRESMERKGVDSATIESKLTIVQGDARDVESVKSTLQLRGQVVDMIVSGIGARPVFQWSLRAPVKMSDATICRDVAAVILRALAELAPSSAQKPLVVNITTTGIEHDGNPRDVPLAFVFLYKILLHAPHVDKRAMEDLYREHVKLSRDQRVIEGFVNLRASLLTDGKSRGLPSIRQGTDDRPAVGYTISRADVGLFLFEKLIKKDPKKDWIDNGVSITY